MKQSSTHPTSSKKAASPTSKTRNNRSPSIATSSPSNPHPEKQKEPNQPRNPKKKGKNKGKRHCHPARRRRAGGGWVLIGRENPTLAPPPGVPPPNKRPARNRRTCAGPGGYIYIYVYVAGSFGVYSSKNLYIHYITPSTNTTQCIAYIYTTTTAAPPLPPPLYVRRCAFCQ